MKAIPGVADPHRRAGAELSRAADRRRPAARRPSCGIAQRDVANNMLTSLSSSALVAPNFFLNPQNNVNYSVAVQTPVSQINAAERPDEYAGQPPAAMPASATDPAALPAAPVMRLADIADVYPRSSLESVNHYTVQRVIDIAANVDGRDLGATPPTSRRRSTRSARACRHHADRHPRPERGDADLVHAVSRSA